MGCRATFWSGLPLAKILRQCTSDWQPGQDTECPSHDDNHNFTRQFFEDVAHQLQDMIFRFAKHSFKVFRKSMILKTKRKRSTCGKMCNGIRIRSFSVSHSSLINVAGIFQLLFQSHELFCFSREAVHGGVGSATWTRCSQPHGQRSDSASPSTAEPQD